MSGVEPILIDGSEGEGGGQILRTSLALSMVRGLAVRFVNIRANRKQPGLRAQHRTAVLAAARVGAARVEGAEIGSRELSFEPSGIVSGHHVFDVGTAGSTTLVLQTVLPALLMADAPSHVEIVGGTHNPLAPPFDFIERSFVPAIRRLGAQVSASLLRPGFYPAGGGRIVCDVSPAPLQPVELYERGELQRVSGRALISRLPRHIAERELELIAARLDLAPGELAVIEIENALGPGNAVVIDVEHARMREVFSAVGQRGIRAETVAEAAAREARAHLDGEVAVGPHLADQLLVPMALAGGGAFSTLEPTLHTRTNAAVIERFLPVTIDFEQHAERWMTRIRASTR